MTKPQAPVWVVAGAPGSGKSTVADMLLERLDPTPALLDKDTIYNPLEEAVLREAGRPGSNDEWYDTHLKVYEHAGIIAAAREIRSRGCAVMLSLPFTKQIHNADEWTQLVDKLGGGTVYLVWAHSDATTLRQRLEARGLERDADRLANFDDFVAYMQPEAPPPVPHFAVDNRIDASDVHEQVQRIIQGVVV
jgi:predicted kinase